MTAKDSEPMSAEEVAAALRHEADIVEKYLAEGRPGAAERGRTMFVDQGDVALYRKAAALLEQLSSLKEECARVLEPVAAIAALYGGSHPTEDNELVFGCGGADDVFYNLTVADIRAASALHKKLTNTPA